MFDYRYLIIGGGMTASAAIDGIRERDAEGSIGLISVEPYPPYKRPPLSKGLWQGKSIEKIWFFLDEMKVSLHLGRYVETLNITEKTVIDDKGELFRYGKLLIATGGDAVKLPFGGDDIIYFRNLNDYHRLRELSDHKQRFAIVGGGFIGSEIAAVLTMIGKQVLLFFPEEGIGAALFPHRLNQFLNNYYREKGVEVFPRHKISGLSREKDKLILNADSIDGKVIQSFAVDAVVAGIGIRPNVALAEQAGLCVDQGIVVDEQLRTENPDIFAAGDVANFYNPSLGRRMRAEHVDNALSMGECAGRNMAGDIRLYHHLPFFYSDLFDLSYQAVGKTDARLETVEDWKEPYKEGVVYYLDQERVRGVLLWNVWERLDEARALIAKPGPFNAGNLKGKLLP